MRQNWRKEYIFTDVRYRNWIIWFVFRLRRSTSFRKRSGLMATTRMTIMLQSLDRKGFQATGCHGLLPIMVCRYWTHQWAFCNNVKGENYAVWGKFRINEGEQNWSCIHSLGEGGRRGGSLLTVGMVSRYAEICNLNSFPSACLALSQFLPLNGPRSSFGS